MPSFRAACMLLIILLINASPVFAKLSAIAKAEAVLAAAKPADILPLTDLRTLLWQVSANSKKKFLVADHVPGHVAVGIYDLKQINYAVLLAILRNNGLAAVTIDGIVNIVTESQIREYPIPMVNNDDTATADDEWVSRIVHMKNANQAQLAVPALRALMPEHAYMVQVPKQNAILLVDRYGNIRRMTEILHTLEGVAETVSSTDIAPQ